MVDPKAAASKPYSVFVVDDHAVFRSGVISELLPEPRLRIAGQAGSVREAVAGIRETHPDVVLLDVHMPDGGGVEVLRQTAMQSQSGLQHSPRFLALSVSDAAEDVIAVIRSGARGYVTKTTSAAELVAAIMRVAEGDAVFSPRLAGFVLDAFAGAATPETVAKSTEEPAPEVDSLTPREKDVLRLLARGYTYREIAEELFISVKTVETHTSNVLRKTQHSNRHALARWAAAHHLD